MAKVLMVFGSTTGNTESIAHLIEKELASKGHTVNVLNAANADPNGLAQGYDLVLMGCSAWGEDEVEMQDDFATFFEGFDKMGLNGAKVAAFASGDREYPHFCGAADVICDRAQELGATIVTDSLKLEGDGSGDAQDIESYVNELIKAL
ncbi:MAG: flavodoxin [Desulfovibrionaceae bacterium]|nr:flavodoxin [Desulfovibrionaceae bacterium]